MNGPRFFKAPPMQWERAHYATDWSASNPAPQWWAALDLAWMANRNEKETARAMLQRLGWGSMKALYRLVEETKELYPGWTPFQDARGGNKTNTKRTQNEHKTNTNETLEPGLWGDSGNKTNTNGEQNEHARARVPFYLDQDQDQDQDQGASAPDTSPAEPAAPCFSFDTSAAGQDPASAIGGTLPAGSDTNRPQPPAPPTTKGTDHATPHQQRPASPPEPDPLPRAPDQPRAGHRGPPVRRDPRLGEVADLFQAHQPDPAPVEGSGSSDGGGLAEARGKAPSEDIAKLWDDLCQARGKGALKLTDARRKLLRSAVAEVGKDGVIQIAEWVAKSDHQRAAFLRTSGNDLPDTYLRPVHRGAYLDFARSWAPGGDTGRPEALNGVTPAAALEIVSGRIYAAPMKPSGWHPNPAVAQAIWDSLGAMGGSNAVAYDLQWRKQATEAAFMAEFQRRYNPCH